MDKGKRKTWFFEVEHLMKEENKMKWNEMKFSDKWILIIPKDTADGKAIPIIPNDCNRWNLK